MQSFALLALLGGVASGNIIDRAPKCSSDNCYRVLSNTPTVASQFCSTFLQSTTTTTITPIVTVRGTTTISPDPVPTITRPAIPSHISQQCVLSTSTPLATRLSSACSCISAMPTSTSIVTATVTVAPVTTILPPSPCEVLSANSNTYAVTADDTYTLLCDQWFWANFEHPWISGLGSMQECMAACSENDRCRAVDWKEAADGNESTCGILFDYEGPLIGTYPDGCASRDNPPDYWGDDEGYRR